MLSRHLHCLGYVKRAPIDAGLLDLRLTREAVGDHEGVAVGLPHGRQQRLIPALHRDLVMPRSSPVTVLNLPSIWRDCDDRRRSLRVSPSRGLEEKAPLLTGGFERGHLRPAAARRSLRVA